VEIAQIEEQADITDEANAFERILKGEEHGPKRDFIVANAGMLIAAHKPIKGIDNDDLTGQIRGGIDIARDLIDSGQSAENFNNLLKWHESHKQH
jgi:anthranilate phosphoribosyltransferase